jgi:hypothetical protein
VCRVLCRKVTRSTTHCGVWCVVCGVWCVVCGVWCVVCGVGLAGFTPPTARHCLRCRPVVARAGSGLVSTVELDRKLRKYAGVVTEQRFSLRRDAGGRRGQSLAYSRIQLDRSEEAERPRLTQRPPSHCRVSTARCPLTASDCVPTAIGDHCSLTAWDCVPSLPLRSVTTAH